MSIENYEKLRVTADIVIITADNMKNSNERKIPDKKIQVLLIKRDEYPYINMWTLPGGFVDTDTSIISAVENKLRSKTGVGNIYKEQLFTYGDNIDRDPRDRVISVAYLALAHKAKIDKNSMHGNKETDWFWVDIDRNNANEVVDITLVRETINGDKEEIITELGFDHKQIIIDAINRVSSKIVYSDIGFNLVGEEFTIKELQLTYEALVGRELVGFRRTIEKKLVETGKNTLDVKHRPAQLYRRA